MQEIIGPTPSEGSSFSALIPTPGSPDAGRSSEAVNAEVDGALGDQGNDRRVDQFGAVAPIEVITHVTEEEDRRDGPDREDAVSIAQPRRRPRRRSRLSATGCGAGTVQARAAEPPDAAVRWRESNGS